jgi:hypothetical protein
MGFHNPERGRIGEVFDFPVLRRAGQRGMRGGFVLLPTTLRTRRVRAELAKVEHPEGFLEIRHSPPRFFLLSSRVNDSDAFGELQEMHGL